mgnify:CR=1 FL=1
MASRMFSKGVASLVILSSFASPSFAGGLERGGYNIDQLFDTGPFSFDSSAVYVAPQRKLKNVVDTDTTTGFPPPGTGVGGGDLNYRPDHADETEGYWVPRVGLKASPYEPIDCMVDYSEPWGAHTNPGQNWAGANYNIETKVYSHNYAGTCSYKFDMGKGQLRLIGGGFYQEVGGFKERLVQDFTGTGVPLSGVGRLDLKGDGWGWRAGVAYEIPEYAIRASLVYNSEVRLDDITGTIDIRDVRGAAPVNFYDVFGSAKMPDSLELKLQSGIAPDWLAFGSVKWTDWSQLQVLNFCPAGGGTTAQPCSDLDLLYRDGWTITGGIGHKFNDQWSGAVSLTWDRGTSQGFGTQTDTWTLGTGVAYTPNSNVELRVAGALGVLTSGKSGVVDYQGVPYGTDVSYSFGNDLVAAISANFKVKF